MESIGLMWNRTKDEQKMNESQEVENNNSTLFDFLRGFAEIGEIIKESEHKH